MSVFSSILKVAQGWLVVQWRRTLHYEWRDTSSNLVKPAVWTGICVMFEIYETILELPGISLIAIQTYWWLSSMVKSITLTPKRMIVRVYQSSQYWFVTQLDQSTGLLHRELRVRVSPGQQWMNSSAAEQSPVKRQDESSNLSSSATVSTTKLESRDGL